VDYDETGIATTYDRGGSYLLEQLASSLKVVAAELNQLELDEEDAGEVLAGLTAGVRVR
jgi:hypothetical protein